MIYAPLWGKHKKKENAMANWARENKRRLRAIGHYYRAQTKDFFRRAYYL